MTKLSEVEVTYNKTVDYRKEYEVLVGKKRYQDPIKLVIDSSWNSVQLYLGRIKDARGYTGLGGYPEEWVTFWDRIDKEKIDELYEKFKDSKKRNVIEPFKKIARLLNHLSELFGNTYEAMEKKRKEQRRHVIKTDVRDICRGIEFLEQQKP